MLNYDKSFETKKVIATLHYMGVSTNNKNVIKFINIFIRNKFEGMAIGWKLTENLHSNNVRILNGFQVCEEFKEVYALFDDGKISVDAYYDAMQEIKLSIVSLALKDIWQHYQVGTSYNTDDQLNLLFRLFDIDLQFPFKFVSSKYTTVINNKLLHEYQDIVDIVSISTSPYNFVEHNECTVQLKPEFINLLNTHFNSKHKIPRNLQKSKTKVIDLINNLKDHKYSNTILIISNNQTSVTLNDGLVYEKTNDLLAAIENNDSIIVTDSLATLNTNKTSNYTYLFVSDTGKLSRYIQKTGKLHKINGSVYVR